MRLSSWTSPRRDDKEQLLLNLQLTCVQLEPILTYLNPLLQFLLLQIFLICLFKLKIQWENDHTSRIIFFRDLLYSARPYFKI
jgi:hypothetical protein